MRATGVAPDGMLVAPGSTSKTSTEIESTSVSSMLSGVSWKYQISFESGSMVVPSWRRSLRSPWLPLVVQR